MFFRQHILRLQKMPFHYCQKRAGNSAKLEENYFKTPDGKELVIFYFTIFAISVIYVIYFINFPVDEFSRLSSRFKIIKKTLSDHFF